MALGILTEKEKKIHLDNSFPFLGPVSDLVITSDGYLDDLGKMQERIDSLFGNDYYISGYLGACQNGFPIDHEPMRIDLFILNLNSREENFCRGLNSCSYIELQWSGTDEIPRDVKRKNIISTEIWSASLERSLVDMLGGDSALLYPFALLLVQNYLDDMLDLESLLRISGEKGKQGLMSIALSELPGISGRTPQIKSPGITNVHREDIVRNMKAALNTIRGW
jgi:hypothetical protein